MVEPTFLPLQSRDLECQPQTGVALRIATFFVLSILCHAATLHSAPGTLRRVVFVRGIGMVFSPVTAGLFSMRSLGRMGVAWISIAARTLELLARILAPETPPETSLERRHTMDLTNAGEPDPYQGPLPRRNSAPDLSRIDSQSEKSVAKPVLHLRSTDSPKSPNVPRSPEVQLHVSPIQSSLNIATRAMSLQHLRASSAKARVDIAAELPHRMHTRALIAGAIAIHVPRRFEKLLKTRNWERLGHHREVSTEQTRVPESDPAFDELLQYILPPTAVVLDKELRIYPESMFREATAGLLQLGFGLYQLISSDAHFSVQRDGLASPFLMVLPYLGMAAVNTVINILDPAYPVITVLDISYRARRQLNHRLYQRWSGFNSPASRSMTGYFPLVDASPVRTKLEERESSVLIQNGPVLNQQIVQSPTSLEPSIVQDPSTEGSWFEFVEWIEFAYDKRIDVSPVDRLYRTAWISHSIIIGEFISMSLCGFFIPLVMLAVVGGWTRFRTSNYGLSLTFNLLSVFGLPFIQLVLYTHHLLLRVRRELRGRKEHGTFYCHPHGHHKHDDRHEAKKVKSELWASRFATRRSMWWITIAQSVGIYFPVRRSVIVVYVSVIIGVAVCEFVFVGINLQRTLSCQGALI